MSGQGRGNYVRRAGLKRKRLTNAEKAVKMFKAPSTARAVTSRAGVPGAAAHMTTGIQPQQETKTFDTVLSHIGSTGDWSYVLSTSLSLIRVGAGSQQRIGRKIRLMGISVRLVVNTGTVLTSAVVGQPYSLHLIQDKQANGAVPAVSQVYTSTNRYSLPDANYLQRFKWLHSIERQGQQTAFSMVTFNFPCNIPINYDADSGTITDIESNNILMLMSTDTATSTLTGIVRFTYVDA